MLKRWKTYVRLLKRDTYALYLACRHPDTPWYARALAAIVAAYAFSPIDLIPDFVPILGYLDDLILVPLGILLAVRLIPAPILAACRAEAETALDRPVSRRAAAIIIVIWIALALATITVAYRSFPGPARPLKIEHMFPIQSREGAAEIEGSATGETAFRCAGCAADRPALPLGWKGFLAGGGAVVAVLCPACVRNPSAVVAAVRQATLALAPGA